VDAYRDWNTLAVELAVMVAFPVSCDVVPCVTTMFPLDKVTPPAVTVSPPVLIVNVFPKYDAPEILAPPATCSAPEVDDPAVASLISVIPDTVNPPLEITAFPVLSVNPPEKMRLH
jgi:hypothetical protein